MKAHEKKLLNFSLSLLLLLISIIITISYTNDHSPMFAASATAYDAPHRAGLAAVRAPAALCTAIV